MNQRSNKDSHQSLSPNRWFDRKGTRSSSTVNWPQILNPPSPGTRGPRFWRLGGVTRWTWPLTRPTTPFPWRSLAEGCKMEESTRPSPRTTLVNPRQPSLWTLKVCRFLQAVTLLKEAVKICMHLHESFTSNHTHFFIFDHF